MRNDIYVVGFGPVCNLRCFGDTSNDAEVDAGIVDQFFFDYLSERPL